MRDLEEIKSEIFRRSEEKIKLRKKKTRIFVSTMSLVCVAAVIGIGFFGGSQKDITADGESYGVAENEPEIGSPAPPKANTSSGQNDKLISDKWTAGTGDLIGIIYYNGDCYVQDTETELTIDDVTLGEYLGDAADYEGTYIKMTGVTAELYTVENRSDVLCAKVSNGAYVFLFKLTA